MVGFLCDTELVRDLKFLGCDGDSSLFHAFKSALAASKRVTEGLLEINSIDHISQGKLIACQCQVSLFIYLFIEMFSILIKKIICELNKRLCSAIFLDYKMAVFMHFV